MSHHLDTPVSRRQLLLGTAGAAAGGLFLSACGSSSSGGGAQHGTGNLPAFVKPREVPGVLVSSNQFVPMGVETYPYPLYKSVEKVPGSGGKVTAFQQIYGPPPPKPPQNVWWAQLNQRLGVQWEPTLVPSSNYADKIATVLASGDIPDLTYIRPDVEPPAGQAVVQGAFTNLTDALSGDAVKKYPNLAHLPTYLWERSSVNGAIWGVPRPTYPYNKVATYRADWAEQAGITAPPKNADELLAMWKAFATGKNRWAIGALDATITEFSCMMYRVPNQWRLGDDGKFTHMVETDEYEQAIGFLNGAWRDRIFHPDALLLANDSQKSIDAYVNGQVGFKRWSPAGWFWVGGPNDQQLNLHPDARSELLSTPGYDGKEPLVFQQTGWYGMAAIPAKVGKDDKRLAELLRILDYWAAPFGSEEYLFLSMGVEGRQFTFDDKHQPIKTTDSNLLNETEGTFFNNLTETVYSYPGTTGRASQAFHFAEKEIAHSRPDPTLGLYSPTAVSVLAGPLWELQNSWENDAVSGRKPMSSLKDLREQWRKQGGDQVRQEFQEALQRKGGNK